MKKNILIYPVQAGHEVLTICLLSRLDKGDSLKAFLKKLLGE